jgi:predicted nucleic acid-binding protein
LDAWVLVVVALAATAGAGMPAAAESLLTVGPRSVQTLIVEQLFEPAGRWYLTRDGGCFAYLDAPQIRIAADRLVLRARLSARIGQSTGTECLGADVASGVTVSGKLHGAGHALVLEDMRIDRVDDDAARSALNLALQLDPRLLPHTATIDLSEFVRRNMLSANGTPVHLEDFRIASITTRPNALVMHFDLELSAP